MKTRYVVRKIDAVDGKKWAVVDKEAGTHTAFRFRRSARQRIRELKDPARATPPPLAGRHEVDALPNPRRDQVPGG